MTRRSGLACGSLAGEDDVYDCIGNRPKLEGEAEDMGVCATKRVLVSVWFNAQKRQTTDAVAQLLCTS